MLHSKAGPNRNKSRVKDTKLDKMIEDQRIELDADKRRKQIYDIQRYIAEKMYYVPTVVGSSQYGRQPWVKNFHYGSFYGVGTETYARIWLKKG